ncbi:histidine phosphatase family protein [Oceanospirillum linum]|uniref:Alpha-ribazole phosphatase n=1 Tax=Oceanospirillum linum TaxID=966 RepID=A0A1T1HA15_OCELI|nr:histidine phosphatase family protein [Oceanospirillum linum]OOV86606.1 hypothetical protein BTA35_0211965 [Oceanospirillum linum]SEG28553.1 alpha-ribazole phosphatase [Oleiphilus messinensis]SMP26790.1 alpha-ribazole phosphatase [Oceanospirillum linum]
MITKTCDYLLIRHLKPQVDAGICYGATDLPAEELPSTAWQKLGQRCDLPVISSPLQRASELARYIAQCRGAGASPYLDDRWQELNFGHWEGLSWQDIGQHSVERWQQNLLNFSFPEGESASLMQQRVLAAFHDWQRQATGGVLVTHLGVIRMVLGHVLQIPFQQQLVIQVDYQQGAWLRQSWLEDITGEYQEGSALWQLKGLNLSAEVLSASFT